MRSLDKPLMLTDVAQMPSRVRAMPASCRKASAGVKSEGADNSPAPMESDGKANRLTREGRAVLSTSISSMSCRRMLSASTQEAGVWAATATERESRKGSKENFINDDECLIEFISN